MKTNKYKYLAVIQQNYGFGWEDNSEYSTDSKGNLIGEDKQGSKFETYINKYGKERKREITLLQQDLKEYQLTGYATRIIYRKELNQNYKNITDIINEDTAMYAAHLARF